MSEFSDLFKRSTDIFDALKVVIRRHAMDSAAIDPVEVVGELRQTYPGLSLSHDELVAEVVRAATDANVRLKQDGG